MRKNSGVWILIIAFAVDFSVAAYWHWNSELDKQYPFFDIILHFFGGLGVYLVLEKYFAEKFSLFSLAQRALLLVSATCLVGVLWEFFEYSATRLLFFWGHQINLGGDLEDTLLDLAMDIVGAGFGTFLHFLRQRKS